MMSDEQKKKEANDGQYLKVRTKQFALEIIRLYASLPKRTEALVLGKQLLRSGTSVGAHYREAQRARSNAEFISKFEGGMQELEETLYWFELLEESGIVVRDRVSILKKEANELMAIWWLRLRPQRLGVHLCANMLSDLHASIFLTAQRSSFRTQRLALSRA